MDPERDCLQKENCDGAATLKNKTVCVCPHHHDSHPNAKSLLEEAPDTAAAADTNIYKYNTCYITFINVPNASSMA